MIVLPQVNPVALTLGPVHIYWYGLMYVLGFTIAWFCARRTKMYDVSSDVWSFLPEDTLADLFSYFVLAVVLGGRLGYMMIYKSAIFWYEPIRIFAVWEGGMSFHGGLVGIALALYFFSLTHGYRFSDLVDFAAPLAIPGLGFGRLGNFINGELWGRVTDVPWGMVFPHSDLLPRHPSQLYEMMGEGVLLYFLMRWHQRHSTGPSGSLGAWFVFHYAWIRFCIEFYREPDFDMGYVFLDFFTMGQVLCLLMFLSAVTWLLIMSFFNKNLSRREPLYN